MAIGRFESTEALSLEVEPFIDKTTGDYIESGDAVTVSYTKPDASTSSGAATRDSNTKIWKFSLSAGGNYQQGTWYFRITSDNANTRPQYASVYWGAGSVEDVLTIKTRLGSPVGATISADIANVYSRQGTPAGASQSADVAAVKADTAAIKLKTDNLPAAPASTGDVTTVGTAVAAVNTKLGTPVGASVSADIADVDMDTDLLLSRLGTPAGASIAADLAEIEAETDDIAAVKLKTDNLPAAPASTSDVTTVGTAVAAIDTKLGTPAGASVSADIAAIEANAVAIKAKTDLIPAAPASTGDVTTVGTAVAAVSTKLGTPAGASVSADVAAVKSDTAAVKLKTDNLPSDPASSTNVTAAITSIKGSGSPDIAAVQARLGTPAGASVSADIAAIEVDAANIAAIKAKTDNLPAAPASTGDVTTVGTAVAAVSTKLGTPVTSVSADIAAVQADTVITRTIATNDLVIDPDTKKTTIYDDDGFAGGVPFIVWDTKGSDGLPSGTSVFQRIKE